MDNNGIIVRDDLYKQFAAYFDLDRNENVYVKSFVEYLKNPSFKNFNFFKVNPNILNNQIGEFIKNSIETNKDSLVNLENEFKVELYKAKAKNDEVNITEVPEDILIEERINAKLF